MSTILVRRQERRPPPPAPKGEILLESPPEIPEVTSGGFQAVMTYLPMAAMAGMTGLMMAAGGPTNPMMMVSSGGMALAMGGMMLGQMGRGAGERKFKLNGERRDYYRYLAQTRRKVRRATTQQREALEWNSPAPALAVVAGDERPSLGAPRTRPGLRCRPHRDRPAEAGRPARRRPRPSRSRTWNRMTAGALRRFVRAHSMVPTCRSRSPCASFARIVPMGDPETVRGLVRAMIAQIAAFHSPDDVRICSLRLARPDALLGVGQVAAAHDAPDRRTTPPVPYA